jgi:hypothetical protein
MKGFFGFALSRLLQLFDPVRSLQKPTGNVGGMGSGLFLSDHPDVTSRVYCFGSILFVGTKSLGRESGLGDFLGSSLSFCLSA